MLTDFHLIFLLYRVNLIRPEKPKKPQGNGEKKWTEKRNGHEMVGWTSEFSVLNIAFPFFYNHEWM